VPHADYRCIGCGEIVRDHVFRMSVGAAADAPSCPTCDVLMSHIPAIGSMDVGGVKGASFKRFDVDVDGQRTSIDSLHTLRRIERESEQRYRNGEGEPLRFRGFSQDASNKDVGSFGTEGTIGAQTYSSGQAPRKKSNIATTRHGQERPKVRVAKGAGQSALKG
jgi:hypothetical protein